LEVTNVCRFATFDSRLLILKTLEVTKVCRFATFDSRLLILKTFEVTKVSRLLILKTFEVTKVCRFATFDSRLLILKTLEVIFKAVTIPSTFILENMVTLQLDGIIKSFDIVHIFPVSVVNLPTFEIIILEYDSF
jgi:hypothetical protein